MAVHLAKNKKKPNIQGASAKATNTAITTGVFFFLLFYRRRVKSPASGGSHTPIQGRSAQGACFFNIVK